MDDADAAAVVSVAAAMVEQVVGGRIVVPNHNARTGESFRAEDFVCSDPPCAPHLQPIFAETWLAWITPSLGIFAGARVPFPSGPVRHCC